MSAERTSAPQLSLDDLMRVIALAQGRPAAPLPTSPVAISLPHLPDSSIELLISIVKPLVVQLLVDALKDRPALQPFVPMLVDLIVALLLKKDAPPAAAAPAPTSVPSVAPAPAAVVPAAPSAAPLPQGGSTMRKFTGLEGHYGNYQHGKEGQIRGNDDERGHEVFKNGGNIDAANEKTKFIMYLTPLVDGERLEPGDPENRLIQVEAYGVVFDGVEYWGDDIQKTPIELNNYEASYGMDPRVVIAAGLTGAHTFAGLAKVNGFTWKGDTLYINRH